MNQNAIVNRLKIGKRRNNLNVMVWPKPGHRHSLANFRWSNQNLSIETGRHNKTERMFRYFKYCLEKNIHVVEDELHLLWNCPLYDDIRKCYFSHDWYNKPSTQHLFNTIMKCQHQSLIFILARFLTIVFKKKKKKFWNTDQRKLKLTTLLNHIQMREIIVCLHNY